MANVSVKGCRNRRPRVIVELAADSRDARRTETDFTDALAELHRLLEAYGPPWYTERIHQRTEDVLRKAGRL